MSRSGPEARRAIVESSIPKDERNLEEKETRRSLTVRLSSRGVWPAWVLKLALAGGLGAVCYWLGAFGLPEWAAAAAGIVAAGAIFAAELKLRRMPASELAGGAAGIVAGLLCTLLVTLVVSRAMTNDAARSAVESFALFAFGYLGLMLGAKSGRELGWRKATGEVAAERRANSSLKLLDTSVLIDGRIADICEAHFLDGAIAIPQFVLHELQLVADSGDMLKRQRGRRGLEVVQRLQKMPAVEVEILSGETTAGTDVDRKLVELARRLKAKIVTNDFNLNKVASVQGIAVLNVNQLANALKPAVLPGEPMRVQILREGKEANQGVAYLDDGTMVVVDGARRLVNKTVEVIVTSVHQTTAGKMIFGRIDERSGESLRADATAARAVRGEPGNGG
jgi:uncharacterized protein YacL